MPITINQKAERSALATKKTNSHKRAKAPLVNLSEPGRLRVAHVMALLGISHSTLYAGIQNGRYPHADGRDGKLPYWNTSTIKSFLEA